MNLKPTFFALTTALLAATAHAKAVDWTPYLKGMQNGCNIKPILDQISESKNLSKNVRNSITSKRFDESDDGGYTIRLRNASAFNRPLAKIRYALLGDGYWITLHFTDHQFMKLMPQFTVSDGKRTEKAGSKKYWANEYFYINEQKHFFNTIDLPYYTTKIQGKTIEAVDDFTTALSNQNSNRVSNPDPVSPLFYRYQKEAFNVLYQNSRGSANDWSMMHAGSNPNDYSFELYATNPQGWRLFEPLLLTTLSFSQKNKTISCSVWYDFSLLG